MEIKEPEITRDQILVLQDSNFSVGKVCIVTGAGTGSAGPPPSRRPRTT